MMVGRSEADILEVEDDAGLLTMACMKDLMQKKIKNVTVDLLWRMLT